VTWQVVQVSFADISRTFRPSCLEFSPLACRFANDYSPVGECTPAFGRSTNTNITAGMTPECDGVKQRLRAISNEARSQPPCPGVMRADQSLVGFCIAASA
jgi:hypothetical protein